MVPLIVVLIVAVIVLAVFARTVRIVPQARARVVERLGRYHRTLSPGLALVVPFIDRLRPQIDLREQVVSFPPQPMITEDNLVVKTLDRGFKRPPLSDVSPHELGARIRERTGRARRIVAHERPNGRATRKKRMADLRPERPGCARDRDLGHQTSAIRDERPVDARDPSCVPSSIRLVSARATCARSSLARRSGVADRASSSFTF